MAFPDRPIVGPTADPPLVVGAAAFQQLRVQLVEVGHLGNRHQEVSPGEADQSLDPAFLLAPRRIAEPCFKRVVRPKRCEPRLFNPTLPAQNLFHGGFQVIEH